MFKALTLLLLIGQSPNLWTHSGLGYSSWYTSISSFHFFYRFSIFPGYHYVGGRGVLKVETNKGSPKDNRPL